jgi:hypothetical protein
MTRRRVVGRAAAVVVLLAVASVLIPGSPVYLPNFFSFPGQYEGHSTRYWIASLKSPNSQVRGHAIFALGAMGADGGDAVPALARVLREDADREARHQAALALSKMAPASRAAVPALAEALADQEPAVRMNAAIALFRLRDEARPAIPALIQALKDPENQTNLATFTYTIQEMAARALGRASGGSAEAVPALSDVLETGGSEEMRLAALHGLEEVGPEARPTVPRLRHLLTDNSAEVRQAAADALRAIEGEAAASEDLARAEEHPKEIELPEADRQYIWEIEHHGNLLVKHGFPPLARALKSGDASALSRLLADDFAGSGLGEPHRVRAITDYAEVERLQDAGRPPVPLDRAAFIAQLLELRKAFAVTPPEVKVALMTLSPKQRGQLDGPWEGTAQVRLFGESAPGAPAEVVLGLRYEVPRPTEDVLSRPGWLHAADVLQVLTARAPHYLFAEVGRLRGLDPSRLHDNWEARDLQTTPGGIYVCDFNRDGILDVLVTDVTGNTLYRGRADGTFEDVTDRYGLPRQPSDSTVAAWVDIDGDGWEDLILADHVYRNVEGNHFADYTAHCNLRLPLRVTGILVADYDRDGKLDLYVTRAGRSAGLSWMTGKSGESLGNHLFHNKGNWQFEDVTESSGTLGGHRSSFSAAWLDADNDGWPDLYVINEFGDGVLLTNNRNGAFTEHRLADHPADFGSMGVAVGDVDNDGNIDIYSADMYSKAGSRVIGNLPPDAYPPPVMAKIRRFVGGSQLHLNRGGLKFEQAGKRVQVAAVGWAYGPCLADLDNDGWLDIYATAGFVSRSRDDPDG